MAPTIQFLRTTDPTKVPDGLAGGQVAFSLANRWMFVGVGGDDILVGGTALLGTVYGTTATILGVANVNVPAKPTGKGYEIFDLESAGIKVASSAPVGPSKGQLYVDTSGTGLPTVKMYSGTAWVDAIPKPAVFTLTTAQVTAGTGTGQSAKMVQALVTKTAASGGIGAQADLHTGDTAIVTGQPATDAAPGSFVWDGANWVASGSGLPDATARTGTAATGTGGSKGVVYLARDIDVAATGVPGSVTPDPLAVATAAQVKALADRVSALATSQTMLGTYDASTSGIKTASAAAAGSGRTGFTVGAKISAGSGMRAGDYFIVSDAGTPTGDVAPVNVALGAGDSIFYDGAKWTVVSAGARGGATLHSLGDVSDSATAAVAAANWKGVLVRDSTVADGLPDAYKLVSVVDCGTF